MLAFFEAEAREDLDKAAGWYDRQNAGLGLRFVEQMERLAIAAAEFPESYPEIEPGVRRALDRDFETHLYYCVESDHIRVIAVIHASRKPGTWRKRLS